MPTDTQRAPTREELETAGNDIRVAIVAHSRAFALLQGAADRAMDDSRHDAEADDLLKLTDDTHNALIIAIAKRVREAEANSDVGVAIIAAERRGQVEREGYTTEHDDTHTNEEMASCAACYAMPADCRRVDDGGVPVWWPFGCCDWKPAPQDRVRELAKAGALIAAEIGRLKRLEAPDV